MFKKKIHYDEDQRKFMDAVDKLAKKFGYKRILFAENEAGMRMVQFSPLPGSEYFNKEGTLIYNENNSR